MKKILSSVLLITMSLGNFSWVYALWALDVATPLIGEMAKSMEDSIKYPSWSEFEKIKSIVDTYLVREPNQYGDTWWKTKPNYTPIIEKELKFLILSTYQWHEDFYKTLFPYYSGWNDESSKEKQIKDLLNAIPRSKHMNISSIFDNGSSIGKSFIDASFGVDFSEQSSNNDLKSVIEQKIKQITQTKCRSIRWDDNIHECYRWDRTLGKYLPTYEEFWNETIYLNRESVKIRDIQDQIEYKVNAEKIPRPVSDMLKSQINLRANLDGELSDLDRLNFFERPSDETARPILQYIQNLDTIGTETKKFITDQIKSTLSNTQYLYPEDATYSLEYKSKSYTHEEALKEIESKQKNIEKKDYKKLMNGAKVENIPEIFKRIPNDSVSLYIKNPQNLLSILDQSSSGLQIGGIDSSKKVKEYMSKWLEIESFSQIQKNLKHESAIVLTNLDPTTPEVTFIISEKDRDALSWDGKSAIVKQQDGYIYVSSSQAVLDSIANLKSSDSLAESDDFHYVWWKKSAKIQDAFVFVGDRFFEKITTLDTFIKHYRKIQDHKQLTSLQELVWAYKKAYNRDAKSFDGIIELLSKTWESSLTSESLKNYSIQNGLVIHKNIGSLANTKTISDVNYDLNQITRKELDDYKYSILKYRDIWRASLDPMGIIINQYKDGINIDFFMTPIPDFPDEETNLIFKNFQWVLKDQLDFIRDTNVRSGMASMVFGFDTQKIKEKLDKPEGEIEKMVSMGYKEGQKELFGKEIDILSMLGGEFALGIGSVDDDILDFDAEKADAFFAIQVQSQEKGEELIKITQEQIQKFAEMEGGNEGRIVSQIIKMFSKPSIEEYRGSKISYVDDIGIPFIGITGIAYGYAKGFVYFAWNRNTIKKAIDTALDGDTQKATIVANTQTSTGVLLGAIVDGTKLNENINAIVKKNSGLLYMMGWLAGQTSWARDAIWVLSAWYYQSYERNMLLGRKDIPFQEKIGIAQLTGKDGHIFLKISPQDAHFSSGTIATQWNDFAPKIDTSYTTQDGVDLLEFLKKDDAFVSELTVFTLASVLDNTEQTNIFFHNTLFTLNLGKDEIGFELRIFDGEQQQKNIFSKLLGGDTSNMIIVWVVALILLGGGGWFIMIRRRRKMNESIATLSSVPVSPITETIPIAPQATTATTIANNISTPSTHQDILIPVDPLSTTPMVVNNTPIISTQPQSVITPQQPSDNTIRP